MGKVLRKREAGLARRRRTYDALKDKDGVTRPGSMNGRKGYKRPTK